MATYKVKFNKDLSKDFSIDLDYEDIESRLAEKDGYTHVLSIENVLHQFGFQKNQEYFSNAHTLTIDELITLMQKSDYEIVDIKQEPACVYRDNISIDYQYLILTTIIYK